PKYRNAAPFNNGYAIVEGEFNTIGIIDTLGNQITPFLPIETKENHFYFFDKKGKYGFINSETNKVVIKPKYEAASDFVNGVAAVKRKGKCGLIDTLERIIVPFEYENFEVNEFGFFCMKKVNSDSCILFNHLGMNVQPLINYFDNFTPEFH